MRLSSGGRSEDPEARGALLPTTTFDRISGDNGIWQIFDFPWRDAPRQHVLKLQADESAFPTVKAAKTGGRSGHTELPRSVESAACTELAPGG